MSSDSTAKLCECGCGEPVTVYKGTPRRFRSGHNKSSLGLVRTRVDPPNPSGICMCGCGQPAPIATKTSTYWGKMKGHPQKYIKGHGNGTIPIPWSEEMWDVCDMGYETSCWFWLRVKDPLGYGRISQAISLSGSCLAHVESYYRAIGPVPISMELDHLCRNPSCINPDHLEPVPHRINIQRGKTAKLTQAIADEIRQVYAEAGESPRSRKVGKLTYAQLAERYNVEKRTIFEIINHRRWPSNLPDEHTLGHLDSI